MGRMVWSVFLFVYAVAAAAGRQICAAVWLYSCAKKRLEGGREGGRGRGGGVERIINSFRRRDSCCVVRLNLGPVRLAFTGRDKPPKYRTSQKLTALPRTHRHTHTHIHTHTHTHTHGTQKRKLGQYLAVVDPMAL